MNQVVKPQSIGISNDLSAPRSLAPQTIEDVYRLAKAFANSDLVPNDYRGKEGNAFTAIVMGMEIGLAPMRALQSIAVVNGRPCLWGDAQLAIVRQSGLLVRFVESYEGKEGSDDYTAICTLMRKGDAEPTIERFSIADAKTAKLWAKGGTWTTHPKRMLKYKARAFALRDKFADVLLGLHSAEEMEGEMIDVNPAPVKSKTRNMHQVQSVPAVDVQPVFTKSSVDEDTGEVVFEKITPADASQDDFIAALDKASEVQA